MIDSQSRANFDRQLIKTMELLNKDEDTIILKGQTIVGDGTTAQIAAMLIGIYLRSITLADLGLMKVAVEKFYDGIFPVLEIYLYKQKYLKQML